ncbi:MAG: aminotransferase-like domain-containing protein, partial [Candidatus Baldrarchaeia archaeon]
SMRHIKPVRYDFAAWTHLIPESEIRRLLKFQVPYYFAGGKPGVLPLEIFAKILIDLGTGQLVKIARGQGGEVIDEYNYGPTAGIRSFREVLAERLIRKDNIPLGSDGWEKVIITSGSQQALYGVLDVLIDPGDAVITPSPAYLGFLGPAVKLGANVICVPTDQDGIIPEFVEEAIEKAVKSEIFRKPPEVLYVVADSDNPKGTTLPTKRRQQLFDIAERWNIVIIEDAAYREIQFEEEKRPAIKSFDKDNEWVVYVRSTSKEAAPFRIGYTVLPDAIREQLEKAKGYLDLCSSVLVQKILEIYYKNYIDDFLKKAVPIYKRRCKAMRETIDETFPEGERTNPTGGFFIWWESKKPFDAKKFLVEVAAPNGVVYVPGAAFYPIRGYQYNPDTKDFEKIVPKTNTMRLSYSYNTEDDIRIGIAKLGELLTEYLSS